MPFKNPKAATFYVDDESAFFIVNYLSNTIQKEVTQDYIKFNVYIAPRTYKAALKVKNGGQGLNKIFLLPIFQIFDKQIDHYHVTNYIVESKISYVPSYEGMHLGVTFKLLRSDKSYSFAKSDEFLYIVSVNLNHFITDFAKTFRLKPDPNISLEEYFDSYYQSGNFASIIENSNGEILR